MSRFTRPGVAAGAALLAAAALVAAVATGAAAATFDDQPVVDVPVAEAPALEAPTAEAPAEAPVEAPVVEAPAPVEAPVDDAPGEAAPAVEPVAAQGPVANAENQNHAPHADDDAYTVAEGDVLTVSNPNAGILANDEDPDATNGSGSAFFEVLFKTIVVSPSGGLIQINTDGTFVYTTLKGFSGVDTFTYLAFDGALDSNLATVTITVTPGPDLVVADDEYATTIDQPLSIDGVAGLYANDTFDGGPIGDHLSLFRVVSGATGALDVDVSDGSFEYVPDAGFSGTDVLLYQLEDDGNVSNVGTVTIEVTGGEGPDAPDDGGDPTSAPTPPITDAGDPVDPPAKLVVTADPSQLETLAFTGGSDGVPGLLFAALLVGFGVVALTFALVNKKSYLR